MPSKGYRTMGEELENVAMRLPVSVLAQVDAHIDTLRKLAPWAKVGRSDALRDLVVRGLASVSSLQPAPPTQPALPIALEGVPASERLQSVAPAPVAEAQPEPQPETIQTPYVPPGMQPCLNTRLKHPPYASSEKECPMCANNRRQRKHYTRSKEKQASS
jgi:hypothetical protein